MKKLLIATDLSARSDRALERALSLSRELDAKLTVLHVVDEDLPASLADARKEIAEAVIQEHFDRQTTGSAQNVSVEIVFGRDYIDILRMSEKTEAELIILGLHREDAFKDMFRGTTVERVIRTSNVPVLLVKERVSNPYQRVIVGVDFSVYSRRAVEFAIKFLPSGEFHLVHAYGIPFKGYFYDRGSPGEVSKKYQMEFQQMVGEELATFLASIEAKTSVLEPILEEGMPREVILQQVSRLTPDLLVVGTHGRTGVAHALLGSVAEDLIMAPPCDVLAVKAW